MDSPIVRATAQAGALSAVSNVLGQAIICYRKNKPFSINHTEFGQFVLLSILLCPSNYRWQVWLEKEFPGRTSNPNDNNAKDKPSTSEMSSKQLNYRNTAIKFALDQTLGATVNTILFIGGIALLRGKPTTEIIQNCKDQFWPMMFAGQKLWPAVSLISFLAVPVEYRTTFGSIVGLFWGIYLSLVSSNSKTS